jgi:protein arginine N-methyltransferase 7
MSMLNDRARTRAYAAGIAGCVQQLLQAEDGSSVPPVVLDVGAGTGLLSMLAAKAGAPVVVGEHLLRRICPNF